MRLYLSILVSLILSAKAQAGFVELGVSANTRVSQINKDNYQESLSLTGSVSYYFWEMSALEFSYTSGTSKLVTQASEADPKQTLTTGFELIGLDLVFTLGGKSASLQPYIKIGGAYIQKEIVQAVEGLGSETIDSPKGMVPSAGLGLKIKITETFSLKLGLDAWTSVPINEEPKTIDYAGRAGISWLF